MAGLVRGKVLVDLRNILSRADVEAAGFVHHGVGIAASSPSRH
jgi:hypothetical protein